MTRQRSAGTGKFVAGNGGARSKVIADPGSTKTDTALALNIHGMTRVRITDGIITQLPVAQQRATFLIEALGNQSFVAELLGVSRTQPGKWSRGEELPSPQSSRELIDLDHVVARAVSWLGVDNAKEWLTGANAFLEGARPIDVLRQRGSAEVVDALDAEMSGAYA